MDDSQLIEQKREQYLQEIARRVPTQNHHDKFMVEVYQRLLEDIDWFIRFDSSQVTTAPTPTGCLNTTHQK